MSIISQYNTPLEELKEKYYKLIREKLLYNAELNKFEIKHRELIVISK